LPRHARASGHATRAQAHEVIHRGNFVRLT